MREFKLRTSQRPRPLPTGRWAMSQRWNDILFAHWRVPAAAIAPFLPEGLQPDTFQGSAWVGVVPTWMDRFSFRGIASVPGASSFPELHFRTYVHDHTNLPGIFNLTVDIGSLLATAVVRIAYRMPCNWAEMRLNQRTEREFSFYSRRRFVSNPVIFSARYRGLGPSRRLAEISSGSVEYFFTERYCMFTRNHAGQVVRANLHTVTSPLEDAEAEIDRNDLAGALGIEVGGQDPVLHYSRRLAVYIWPAELVAPARTRARIPVQAVPTG